MSAKQATSLAAALTILCILLSPTATKATDIGGAHDAFETDGATTYQDLTLPADFFGPGSDPFDGRVYLKGVPFDCLDPDGPGVEPLYCGLTPTDTIVRRLADAGPGFPATIPIEIVALALHSAAPITVSFSGGSSFETWEMFARVEIDAATGNVDPPQSPGTMTIHHEHPEGGTFESVLPVVPNLTFAQVGGPGVIGPMPAPAPLTFHASDEPWCHWANPLGFPAGHIVVEAPGLTNDFFPGVFCPNTYPAAEPPVSFSVDGGTFNPNRDGLTPLRPLPNPAEGLRQPDPRHPTPNDVYALGTSPGAQGYATEGEVFQAAGFPLGSPPNGTNVDRMSAALGIGPAPGGPPFIGPFAPNPGGATPAPAPPGVAGPAWSFGPPPGHTVGALGLVPNDNVNALSYGRDSGNVLLFSVDPATVGGLGSAVRAQAVTSPFAVGAAAPLPTNPGGGDPGNEAAGDIFKSVQLPNFGSYGPLHFANGMFLAPAVLAINQLAIDEIDLGLQAPGVNGAVFGPQEDDLDGVELSDTGGLVFGVDVVDNASGAAPPDGIPDRPVLFSLDTVSPSNGLSFGAFVSSPDDILVTPTGGFSFAMFADGVFHIGLLAGDDLDALVVSDVAGLGSLDPGLDEALFSLHPGSPSVVFGPDGIVGNGDEVSPADVLYTNFSGAYTVYAPAATLGLRWADNLNALDILPATLKPQPIPPPIPPQAPVKKLVGEAALLAAHGVRVPEKKPCFHFMIGEFTLDLPGLGATLITLTGTAEVESLSTEFDPETALSEIPTEIVAMDLTGPSPIGTVVVTAGRSLELLGLPSSPGKITQITPGIDFPAESFFDVTLRIEIPGLGGALHNEEPIPMRAEIHAIPPIGDPYETPLGMSPIALYDENNDPTAILFLGAQQTSVCQSDPDCDDGDPCTADICDPTGTGNCLHDPLPDDDGDGVCNAADNCPGLPNPGGQAPKTFDQQIVAPNEIEFCWPDTADILWVRGPLDAVGGYLIDRFEPLPGATCLADPEPVPPHGWYYLVQDECPAASWQSHLGLEPERDPALP